VTGHLQRLVAWVGLVLASAVESGRANELPPIDHYLLALSWSPTFCGSAEDEAHGSQCGAGKRFAFVVHGLWPQFPAGRPDYCPTAEDSVPAEVVAGMLPIMPSARLIVHQWRKHGSCSGLPVYDYFALTKSLFSRLRIPARYLLPAEPVVTSPDDIVSDFVNSNRGLAPSMISVRCEFRRLGARLSEIRICFTPDGGFISCPGKRRTGCKAASLILPPARLTYTSRSKEFD
jgi:ribonuclease T2